MGELRALRWRDVDFANGTLHVRASFTHNRLRTPKSGKVRSVPLIDQAAALDRLSRRGHLAEPEDLVFSSPTGGHVHDGDTRRAFYAALRAAGLGHKREGLKPRTFHDLRHTFGTLAVQVWPLSDVQAYMGHADVTTTMIYVHHVPKRNAAEALTALVDAATSCAGWGKTQPSFRTRTYPVPLRWQRTACASRSSGACSSCCMSEASPNR